jgi:Protein kinase domain
MNSRDPSERKSSDQDKADTAVHGPTETNSASDAAMDSHNPVASQSRTNLPLTGADAVTGEFHSKNANETADYSRNDTGDFSTSDPSATRDYKDNIWLTVTKFEIPGYRILHELGRGAMGVVYKAHQELADRTVALKVMLNLDHAREAELARFKVEAQAAARLEHGNIIHVFDVGQKGDLPYFTLEYVDGGTLADKIAKQMLTFDQSAQMLHTLAAAIAYAQSRSDSS